MKLKRMEWIGVLVSMMFSFSVAYAEGDESVAENAVDVVEKIAPQTIDEPQPVKELYLEINKLEQRDTVCVAYVRFHNQTDTAFAEFKPELFAFDKEDIITAHFAAIFNNVPANKTVVKLVSMKDTQCDSVGSILLNQMLTCKSGENDIDGCMQLLKTGAKGAIKLFK